jgi:hypothetical protein
MSTEFKNLTNMSKVTIPFWIFIYLKFKILIVVVTTMIKDESILDQPTIQGKRKGLMVVTKKCFIYF